MTTEHHNDSAKSTDGRDEAVQLDNRRILILYGSETGNSQDLAGNLERLAERLHFKTLACEMNDVELVSREFACSLVGSQRFQFYFIFKRARGTMRQLALPSSSRFKFLPKLVTIEGRSTCLYLASCLLPHTSCMPASCILHICILLLASQPNLSVLPYASLLGNGGLLVTRSALFRTFYHDTL